MKKLLTLLMIGGLSLTLCACGKDEVITKTCSGSDDDMTMTFKMTATNDEIDKIEMTVVPNNEAMNIETFEDLTDAQKSQIEESFLTTMGLEEEQEGIEVEVKFAKDMTVILKVDLKTADKEILENIGLDFEDKDMSLEKAISDFKEEGYTCN